MVLFGDLIGATILCMSMFLSVAYMLSKILRSPQLEGWCKAEIGSFLVVVVVSVLLISIMDGAEEFSKGIFGKEPIDFSISFLSRILYDGVLPTYADLVQAQIFSSLTSDFRERYAPEVWGISIPIFTTANLQIMILKGIGMGFLALYTTLAIQIIGLATLKIIAPLFFSLGIFLYMMPPTRNAGAFLIGASFGFLVVFPLAFSFSAKALDDMSNIQTGKPFSFQNIVILPELFGGENIADTMILMALKWLPFGEPHISFLGVFPFFYALSNLSVIGFFIPSLSLILTLAFINSTVKVLLWRV